MDESYLSSSPSIPEEEIDFQYVYALRTFTATEQGQATAFKGDAMILLNDSNSYWWLVRLVKDGSVGFLPAEHVETPSERLARLNKHRNGDVSSASFSVLKKQLDKQTKSKPKKKRKTVSFKQVYVSSDEDDDDDDDAELANDVMEFSDFSDAEENLMEDAKNNNLIINDNNISSISIDSTASSLTSTKSVEVKQVVASSSNYHTSISTDSLSHIDNNYNNNNNHNNIHSNNNNNNNNNNNDSSNANSDPNNNNNNINDMDSSDYENDDDDNSSDDELQIPAKVKKNSLLHAKSSTDNLLRRKTSAASITSSSSASNDSLASGSTTDSSPTSSPELFSSSSHKLHPQIIPIYKETSIKLDQISSVSNLKRETA